jgi:mannose-1-phosphate guanylyltransferase
MNNNYYCIIMAGGTGLRFWPLARNGKPKQFLDLFGTGKTFLQSTYDRFAHFIPKENILVVTVAKYKKLVEDQLPQLNSENLLLEPYSRNTAPCIAYSTYSILKRNSNAVMVITPSDHLISDEDLFSKSVLDAMDYATKNEVLMTLGIVPDKPDTSYGYIQVQGGEGAHSKDKPIKMKTFTEKPDAALAEVFYKSGEFFWNSGIYIWQAHTISEELEKFSPEITGLFKGWDVALGSASEQVFLERAYTDCAKISIDYAVMEKTGRAWVYPSRFKWSDIDTWESIYKNFPEKDGKGTAVRCYKKISDGNKGDLIISSGKKKLVAVSGLENYVVIDTDDVLLICPRDDKKIKEFTAGLGMPDFDEFR